MCFYRNLIISENEKTDRTRQLNCFFQQPLRIQTDTRI
jgi:hypothetical protein